MDIFDKLDFVEKKVNEEKCLDVNASPAPELSKKVFLQTPTASSLKKPQLEGISKGQLVSPEASVSSSSREKKEISLLRTRVIAVESTNLVWAPYYRFHNALFPARVCDNEEALAEPSISWPISTDRVVVEIFNQDDHKGVCRLLLLEKKKILPYFASSQKDKETIVEKGQEQWNAINLKKMKKALEEKHTKSEARYVYEEIVKTADSFLQKALLKDKEIQGILVHDNEEPFDSSETRGEAKTPESTPTKLKNAKSRELLQKFALIRSKESIPLHVGDKIYYHQKMGGKEIEVEISGFEDHHKIALSNDEILNGEDLICKVDQDSNGNSIRHSSGYQEVKSFDFREVTATGRTKRKAAVSKSSNPLEETNRFSKKEKR